jgi:hypothetical protein
MSDPPIATPRRASSGHGCLIGAIALPIVMLVGLVIGNALSSPDDSASEHHVTLDSGTLAGSTWRVDAVRDVDGESCAFLYEGGEQLTGACSLTPQDATFGDRTVVFGRAASADKSVRVQLSDERVVEIDTRAAKGISGSFYVEVVDGDVDATGFAP